MACIQIIFLKLEDGDIINKRINYSPLDDTFRTVIRQCMKTHVNNLLLLNKHYSCMVDLPET